MRHVLGFWKLYLLRAFGYAVRLHVWSGDGVEDPHDHRWSFVAVPLLGRFEERRYERDDEGDGYTMVGCWPAAAGDRCDALGPGGLRRVSTVVRHPLRPYRCRRGVIHAYRPIGRGPHVSVVLLARPATRYAVAWKAEPAQVGR